MPALSEPKYETFAREVAAGNTRAAAAVAAGYSAGDAGSRGAKLARRPDIAARIAELQDEAAKTVLETVNVTRQRVIEEFSRIAFFDPAKLFDSEGCLIEITKLDEDTRRAIASIEHDDSFKYSDDGDEPKRTGRTSRLKFLDKHGALVSLARHLGMFRDKVEITGPDGGAVQTTVDVNIDAKTLFAAREKLREAKKLLSEPCE